MVASAVALIVMSFFAYDAASSVRYNPLAPTLGGIIFSIPLGIAGLMLVRAIRDRSERGFLLQKGRLFFGALGLIMWIALGWAYVVQIGNSSTYEGGFNTKTQRWDPNFSERSFFVLTLGLGSCTRPASQLPRRATCIWTRLSPCRLLCQGATQPVK